LSGTEPFLCLQLLILLSSFEPPPVKMELGLGSTTMPVNARALLAPVKSEPQSAPATAGLDALSHDNHRLQVTGRGCAALPYRCARHEGLQEQAISPPAVVSPDITRLSWR